MPDEILDYWLATLRCLELADQMIAAVEDDSLKSELQRMRTAISDRVALIEQIAAEDTAMR